MLFQVKFFSLQHPVFFSIIYLTMVLINSAIFIYMMS